ncbi:MAG: HPr family phosphocarrier protein [Gammaproteobacteria bacterium]|nr:HPr family phosphocarrier protein [Gammaproteobacteria bacterium]
MQIETIEIINKLGLHARASAKLVNIASRFGSHIDIKHGTKIVNAKSIMGVMMLAASKGTKLELQVTGEDEVPAMQALIELINNRFGEEE